MMKRPVGPVRRRIRVIRIAAGGREWSVWWNPWRGCSPPVPVPTVDETWVDVWKEYYLEIESMKMPSATRLADPDPLARIEPPKMLTKLPNVAELLVQPSWEEGSVKGERGLFVFISSTLVKLLVKVENPPVKAMVSGRTWDEAWAALEALLKAGEVPWEADTPRDGKPTRKKR